ncbi:MAG: hypothetical protein V4687_02955 [Bacteroidota bacterium]
MKRINALFFMLFCFITTGFAQVPEEFFKGAKLITTDRVMAKKYLLLSVVKGPQFSEAYHLLGLLYSSDLQMDSAIYYFEKSVKLNNTNIAKTKEMSYIRLMDAYTFKRNFKDAYRTALEGYSLYPNNTILRTTFADVCLWAYYIKHTKLDASYLSPVPRDMYEVTSVNQEYLINRKLMIQGNSIRFKRVGLRTLDKDQYDVYAYNLTDTDKKEVLYKLKWDLNTEFGGKSFPTEKVSSNKKLPIYERLGAQLVEDPKLDILAAIAQLN